MSRQPQKLVAVGGTGVGKTHENMRFIRGIYSNPRNPHGRKTLIYDVNMEFPDVEPIAIEDIPAFNQQTKIEIRRVLPLDPNTGAILGIEGKYDLLCEIVDKYQFINGLLYLEDLNNYAMSAHTSHLINLLTTNRHKLLDMFINLQTFGALPPRIWGNINVLRIHKTNDDPFTTKIKSQISGKLQPLRIAKIMVDTKTMIDKHFFVTLNFDTMKITGNFEIDDFVDASKKYLALNNKFVKDYMLMNKISREDAEKRILVQFMKDYNGNVAPRQK